MSTDRRITTLLPVGAGRPVGRPKMVRTRMYQPREVDGHWHVQGRNVDEPCRSKGEALRWARVLNHAYLTGALQLAEWLRRDD